MKTKKCSRCSVVKVHSDFPKSKGNADGLYSQCKLCKNERSRELHSKRRRSDAVLANMESNKSNSKFQPKTFEDRMRALAAEAI